MNTHGFIQTIASFLVIYVCAFNECTAQSITFNDLPDMFDYAVEISGITGDEETLYLLSEKCGEIHLIDKDSLIYITTIPLNNKKGWTFPDVQLEGITVYDEYLIMTDENDTSSAILVYDTSIDTIYKAQIDIQLSIGDDEKGIEGIATNPSKDLLYLLRERNADCTASTLYTCSIKSCNGILSFELLNNVDIQLMDGENDRCKDRHTGLCLNLSNNSLNSIYSKYNWNKSFRNYRIIEYLLDKKTGLPLSMSNTNVYPNLKDTVIKNEPPYNSNIEGLFYTDGNFYIVSDNKSTGDEKCSESGEFKTAFFTIEIED